MIKILYFEYPQNTNPELGYKQPECIYSLEDIAGGVRVNMYFPEQVSEGENIDNKPKVEMPACNKIFDIIFNDHKGKIRNLRISRTFGDYTLCYSDRFSFQRLVDFTSDGHRSLGHAPILNFSVNEDGSEVVIFLRSRTFKPDYKNGQYVSLETNLWKSYILHLMEHSDFCKRKIENYVQKRENITEWVDIYDTVTYLESQVDALTRLVLKMSENRKSDEVDILKSADRFSVLDIKTADNIKNEFEKDKANARKRQDNFYISSFDQSLSEIRQQV
ncbi:hypothetical protein [uncultured Phascolarctobacterium sp.]|uniref:hypothetical protein n=1 Tax=uncultured Phascolarctobacterium sp. TaxID=512296 RepID=UPI00262362A5|nr:hypothetical protein [uncultured Phascolarctobacterium sp.]